MNPKHMLDVIEVLAITGASIKQAREAAAELFIEDPCEQYFEILECLNALLK